LPLQQVWFEAQATPWQHFEPAGAQYGVLASVQQTCPKEQQIGPQAN
jgi:hypothetical protein